MVDSDCKFCRLYRPIGALLLLAAILLLLLRSCNTPAAPMPAATGATAVAAPAVAAPAVAAPAVAAPATIAPTAVPPTAVPATAVPPTAVPLRLPELALPAAADFSAEGVKLGGTGEPGATVEIWDGTTKVSTAVVGADGRWNLLAELAEGAHKLAVRTVDAAGKVLNEAPALDVTVPAIALPEIKLPELALPAAADFSADGVKLSGTGEPGATIEIRDGTVKIDSAVVGADGRWNLLAELAEGAHKLAVRTVDAAGKVLNEAPALDVTVPAIALPEIKLPELALPAAADFSAEGVKLNGTGEPGATIEIRDGTTRVGTAVVGADGRWNLLAQLAEGARRLVVRTVDAAGKILNEAPAVSVTVPQAQPPAATGEPIVLGAAYVVKAGDWLSSLAQAAYGDWRLYPLIVEATNARAAEDATFATIDDSNLIEPGWKIWIPAKPAGN